jgi:hypothetical protein
MSFMKEKRIYVLNNTFARQGSDCYRACQAKKEQAAWSIRPAGLGTCRNSFLINYLRAFSAGNLLLCFHQLHRYGVKAAARAPGE